MLPMPKNSKNKLFAIGANQYPVQQCQPQPQSLPWMKVPQLKQAPQPFPPPSGSGCTPHPPFCWTPWDDIEISLPLGMLPMPQNSTSKKFLSTQQLGYGDYQQSGAYQQSQQFDTVAEKEIPPLLQPKKRKLGPEPFVNDSPTKWRLGSKSSRPVTKSEGFDVSSQPPDLRTGMRTIRRDGYADVIPYCVEAIAYYNWENGTKYQFVRLNRANVSVAGSAGFRIFLTFQARVHQYAPVHTFPIKAQMHQHAPVHTFEAKVFQHSPGVITVEFCRLKVCQEKKGDFQTKLKSSEAFTWIFV